MKQLLFLVDYFFNVMIFFKENDDYAEKTIRRKRTVRRFNYATNKKLKPAPRVLEKIDLTGAPETKMLVFFISILFCKSKINFSCFQAGLFEHCFVQSKCDDDTGTHFSFIIACL